MAQARDRVKNALVAKPLCNRCEPPPMVSSTTGGATKVLVGGTGSGSEVGEELGTDFV